MAGLLPRRRCRPNHRLRHPHRQRLFSLQRPRNPPRPSGRRRYIATPTQNTQCRPCRRTSLQRQRHQSRPRRENWIGKRRLRICRSHHGRRIRIGQRHRQQLTHGRKRHQVYSAPVRKPHRPAEPNGQWYVHHDDQLGIQRPARRHTRLCRTSTCEVYRDLKQPSFRQSDRLSMSSRQSGATRDLKTDLSLRST